MQSPERLLDETALFLHRVIADLPEGKRRMLERLHDSDESLAGKKVLVVDDDVRNIFALSSVLERHGMAVVTATTGQEAIELIERTPDLALVLMDIMMPEMDGYETMRRIRKLPQHRLLPDDRADREGDEGRPRKVPRSRRVRLHRQARQHRTVAGTASHVAPPVTAVAAQTAPERHDERVSILLVDDQPARLLSYDAILADFGQNLVRAQSGREALQRLMEREYAAILLDVNMPDIDGFETAALIHRHPRFEKTPIIFVTAVHVTDLDRLKGYQLGAFDYVYVPVVPEILRSKVQVLVELHAQRKSLERLNRKLEQANAELALAHSSLQAERARELQALNRTLEKANLELAEANSALEAEIVERRRAESAVREADRRKNEFLAMLSHELRNPLAAIANAVQFLQRAAPADPGAGPARDVLVRQVEHLIRLIDDLLDISRITRGTITLRPQRVELAEVIARAFETTRPLALERRQRLALTLADEALTVEGDPVRLAQAIGNLLTNAIKYTAEEGSISVVAERASPRTAGQPPEAVIRIVDTGIGISAELMPTIFELFGRADHSPSRQDGLGIGLALVRELVALHGGSVEAASAGTGQGATFSVRLPLASPAVLGARPEDDSATQAGVPPSTRRRVLLVDDNRDSAESLAALMQMLGHEVLQAHGGREAIELARACRPELVLLDIGMPDLNGYDVARALRAEPGLSGTWLIALTGYGSDDDRSASRAAGFDDHLVKPIDFDRLERILARLPAASRAAQQSEAA